MMILNAVFKVLPVLFIITLGYLLGRRKLFSPEVRYGLKQIIINVALPATLFLAFVRVRLELGHLLIVAIVFSACFLVFILSRSFQPARIIRSQFFPYLMTGFEAGMLGYAIFSAVYGAENIFKFGIIDLGQVTFVFFVLVPALEEQSIQKRDFRQVALTFIKTPVIIAILAGVILNQTGLNDLLSENPAYESLQSALQLLAGLTTPLVALVIGSEIYLDRSRITAPLRTSLIRLLIWIPATLIFIVFIMDRLLGLDRIFLAAALTMAILPPPFVVPLYMKKTEPEDQYYVVNTLSLSTIFTLFLYVIVTIIFPPAL
jgi:predicted permease